MRDVYIAITNSGSVRAGIPIGPLDMAAAERVLPFKTPTAFVYVNGSTLRAMLELSVSSAAPAGRFLCVEVCCGSTACAAVHNRCCVLLCSFVRRMLSAKGSVNVLLCAVRACGLCGVRACGSGGTRRSRRSAELVASTCSLTRIGRGRRRRSSLMWSTS